MEKGKYNPYDEDVDLIQDDENVKIVKVNTLNSAQYFGSDFYGNDNWERHYRDGDLYFIISKKDDSLYSIFNDSNGSVIRDLNKHNDIVGVNDVKRAFLSSLKVLSPLIKGGKTYEFLKEVSKGYDPHWRSNGDDPLIDEVKFNTKNPSNSKVIIKFEDDEVFLDTINIGSSDDIYTYRSFTGNYSGRDYDIYNEQERWGQGEYVEYHFNEENKRKAYQIARFFDFKVEEDNFKYIATVLNDHFERDVDDLISEYSTRWQDCIDEVVKDIILDEVGKPFDKFGIKEIYKGYRFETTVGVLLHWYQDIENYRFTLSDLLNKLMVLYDKKERGYWGDLEYGVDCIDWDDDYIQGYYSKCLDRMLEKIEEDDDFINIDEYRNINDVINDKYGHEWRNTEKDPNIKFLIIKVEPETNKVLVNVHNDKTKKTHQRLLDLDGLYQLDNQPELFNEIRIVRKKFL